MSVMIRSSSQGYLRRLWETNIDFIYKKVIYIIMNTLFPFLSDTLDIKESKYFPNQVWVSIDRRTIRTRDYVAGILLLSELSEDYPDLKGRLHGRLSTHREDLYHGVDFRIFSDISKHLIDIDFTMDRHRYSEKVKRQENVVDYPKKIALINGSLLLWITHEANRVCYENPGLSKDDIRATIPKLKKPQKSIVIEIS